MMVFVTGLSARSEHRPFGDMSEGCFVPFTASGQAAIDVRFHCCLVLFFVLFSVVLYLFCTCFVLYSLLFSGAAYDRSETRG